MENTNGNLGEGTTNAENLAAGSGLTVQTSESNETGAKNAPAEESDTKLEDANKSEEVAGNVAANGGTINELQDNGEVKKGETPTATESETLGEKIADEINKAEEFVGEKLEEVKDKVEGFFEKDKATAEAQGEDLLDDVEAKVDEGINGDEATATEEAVDHNDQTKFPPSQV